mgnify:CR=1 FL=1
MHLLQIAHLLECTVVPKRHKQHAVMDECAERVHRRDLLSAAHPRCGDEDSGILPCKGARGPEVSCRVPERLLHGDLEGLGLEVSCVGARRGMERIYIP